MLDAEVELIFIVVARLAKITGRFHRFIQSPADNFVR